ncbi:MAG: biotin--[Oscillospiraceae bacterium]|nr:biotin--[acetyl-CoA-carboxylase] ligase [Oscillospiraceae bacterium]
MKEEIIKNLRESCLWQDSLLWFDSIDSTNTRARELARQGAAHSTVLIADCQTGGRGRLGRSFHSPAGSGIYLSVILRLHCTPQALMHLTCAAAVAMCDAVEKSAGFRPGIKWTNDLVYGKRKIAGVLTELGFDSKGNVDFAVVGIGINCCQQEADFPEEIRSIAGSLASVSGKKPDRAKVAAAMIAALQHMDMQLLTGKAQILNRYRQDCITLGQEVSLVRGEEIRHGTALDIDEDGALIVRFHNGLTETVNSGEVSVRGMYGYV